MATFLVELRCEEIPANALPGARRQLVELATRHLAELGLGGATVTALSTSRRLVLLVGGLAERQPDRTEQVLGPPARVAFTPDGAPTKAAEGFAAKVGMSVAAVGRASTDKGEYLAATVTHPGRATAELFAELVPALVAKLRFPKMMRWGLGEHLFVRPVHGVVALFAAEVVPLELFGLASGRTTTGHRVHQPAPFDLASADDYVEALRSRSVLVDPEERREILERTAATIAAAGGLAVHPDPGLVAEHVELVEYPGLATGAIADRFLELPREVVVTTLRHHQKCLVLEDADGRLQPRFLTVVDRRDDPEGLIRQGNEWVIGARLADAAFFFAEDRKRRLADLLPALDRIEWHRVMGSLGAKATRVGALAWLLADSVGAAVDGDETSHVARLAKADLASHMVGEFPELQGVMGGHYLCLEGSSEEVWTAVRDHYTPVGFEGRLPSSGLGRLIGAADRLDTLAALFAAGERPTGSKDPFGLRRAGQGLVRIVVESGWDVALGDLVEHAAHLVANLSGAAESEVVAALEEFLADRVRRYLMEVAGVSGDTAEAVMAAGWMRLPQLVVRATALEKARVSDRFRALSLAFKRVRNITDGQPESEVEPTLFEHEAEGELHRSIVDFHSRLAELLPAHRVDEAFRAMEPIADTLDRFFVEVLVMADDPRVRANRIALLKRLGRDFMDLADLSKLQIEGGD